MLLVFKPGHQGYHSLGASDAVQGQGGAASHQDAVDMVSQARVPPYTRHSTLVSIAPYELGPREQTFSHLHRTALMLAPGRSHHSVEKIEPSAPLLWRATGVLHPAIALPVTVLEQRPLRVAGAAHHARVQLNRRQLH